MAQKKVTHQGCHADILCNAAVQNTLTRQEDESPTAQAPFGQGSDKISTIVLKGNDDGVYDDCV